MMDMARGPKARFDVSSSLILHHLPYILILLWC